MKNFVSINWLKDNLDREDLFIFDCRFNLENLGYGRKMYEEAHIKNAHFINLEGDLSLKPSEHGGRHPLPSVEEFVKKLESYGLSNNSIVVIYDDGDFSSAPRFWWMLKYIGFEEVYVLEGGFYSWSLKGFPMSKIEPKRTLGSIQYDIEKNMICDINYVKSKIDSEDTLIIDSRDRNRYLGIEEPMDKKPGHIPNAKNYPWKENYANFTIKPEKKIKERFKKLAEFKEIIVYCGSGITACANIIILDEIGIKTKLYSGSYSDWVSYEDNPVVLSED